MANEKNPILSSEGLVTSINFDLQYSSPLKHLGSVSSFKTFSSFVFYPTLPPRRGQSKRSANLLSLACQLSHELDPSLVTTFIWCCCLHQMSLQASAPMLHHYPKGTGWVGTFNPPIYLWLSLQPKWPQGMRCYSTSIPFHFVLHVYQSMLLFQNIQQLRVLPHPPSKKGAEQTQCKPFIACLPAIP